MNEYPNEINFFLQRFGMRPIEYLEKLGVLDERFLAAHCILLSENEKDLLKKYNVKTCHCPFSNCGKGIPDTPALFQRGITVGLGTDGAAHGGLRLWNEMKIFRSVMNVGRGVGISEAAASPAASVSDRKSCQYTARVRDSSGCLRQCSTWKNFDERPCRADP